MNLSCGGAFFILPVNSWATHYDFHAVVFQPAPDVFDAVDMQMSPPVPPLDARSVMVDDDFEILVFLPVLAEGLGFYCTALADFHAFFVLCGSDFHNGRSPGYRILLVSVEQCNTGSAQFQVFSIPSDIFHPSDT